jgi:CBS-domain-containing membrane protein
MTDLTQVAAVVIEPQATMELAHSYMMQRGVRMLLALDKDETLAGIVTANDILGERPVSLVREQRIRHSDILVADVMTPAERLDAFEMRQVAGARVGHIVSSLQESRRHHALVVQHNADGKPEVRGIFSLTQNRAPTGHAPATTRSGRLVRGNRGGAGGIGGGYALASFVAVI